MKICSDFVSNSSSSSFILATNASYKLKDFAKDLGKTCAKADAEYHDKNLANRNRVILEFCLTMYQAAFVGAWKLKTKEDVFSKEQLTTRFKFALKQSPHYVDDMWNDMITDINECKKSNCDPLLKKEAGRDYLDKDGKIHTFRDIVAYTAPVDGNTMQYKFHRYGYDNDDSKDNIAYRIKNLKEFAKNAADENGDRLPEVFSITKASIMNTRQLIAAGEEIDLGKLNLDDLEKRLDGGEKIYSIRVAHSGDGYGIYYIYDETEGCWHDGLAAEILTSESM